MTIYLVSCVKRKQDKACLARDMYISDWFMKARRFVENADQPWFILSAKYGLLSSDTFIEPYEQTLNNMAVAERRAWGEQTSLQLMQAVPDIRHVSFLAGMRYREFIRPDLERSGVKVDVPMEGLGIGKQLNWLLSKLLPATDCI